MNPKTLEMDALTKVAEDYRRNGYDVKFQPDAQDLPVSFENYRPDLIARGPSETVVVEVVVGGRRSVAERYRDVSELVNREPGWRFSLVYVNPERPDEILDATLPSIEQIQDRLHNAESLANSNQPEAAFLLLWSALEGVLRIIGHNANPPMESLPSSTLLRELYSAGEIGRESFETAMELLQIRNRLAHGFQEGVDGAHVEQLRQLIEDLLGEVMCNP